MTGIVNQPITGNNYGDENYGDENYGDSLLNSKIAMDRNNTLGIK